MAKSWVLGVNKAFPWWAPNFEFLCRKWLLGHEGIVQKVKRAKTTHVLDKNAAKPLWCVKNYQFVGDALTALVLLHSGNIRDCLRLISVFEPRIAVNMSRHMFNMTLSSNSMKDLLPLWISVVLRKCAIILDRSHSIARVVTYCSKWSHIWDHSTKAVNCFPCTTSFPLLLAQWCI